MPRNTKNCINILVPPKNAENRINLSVLMNEATLEDSLREHNTAKLFSIKYLWKCYSLYHYDPCILCSVFLVIFPVKAVLEFSPKPTTLPRTISVVRENSGELYLHKKCPIDMKIHHIFKKQNIPRNDLSPYRVPCVNHL